MTTQALEGLIRMRYDSIAQFAAVTGLPPTTIYGVLKRGIKTASLETMRAICNGLDLSLDAVAGTDQLGYPEKVSKVVDAYLEQPELQPAVDKLLGLDGKE